MEINLARREGLSPLYYSLHEKTCPDAILDEFRKDYYRNARRNVEIFEELKHILEQFREARIEVIVLKGTALAEIIYKNIALRPLSDVDLLIKKENLAEVDGILRKLGYSALQRESHLPSNLGALPSNAYTYEKLAAFNLQLDLHWHLVNVPYPLFAYASKIDMDKIWFDSIKARIAAEEALILSPHHMIIHLAEHSFRHLYNRRIFLYDIALAIKHYDEKNLLNWDKLVHEVREFGLQKPVYFSLYIVRKLLCADVPANVFRALRPKKISRLERKLISVVLNGETIPPPLYRLVYLIILEGFSSKIKLLWRSIFLDRESLALVSHSTCPKTFSFKFIVQFLKRLIRLLLSIPRILIALIKVATQQASDLTYD